MSEEESTVHQKKGQIASSTQRFLPIAEIRDNTLVLKNGGIRSIIKTSSVNFNLKSSDEQNALIYAYQGFLNTITFPIQILIRSRKLDIDMYIDNLGIIAKKQTSPLMRKQTMEYTEYIKKLVEYADIMEKNFYVIVPHDPARANELSIFQKFSRTLTPEDSLTSIRLRHREFEKLRKKLTQRVNTVCAGLEGCGLRATELGTNEIVELFYQIYNPGTSRNQKFQNLAGQDILPI